MDKPNVRLLLRGGNIWATSQQGETGTGLALDARIWNIGAPTAIVKWRLEIIPRDVAFSCDLTAIPERIELDGPVKAVILGSESLDKRLNVQLLGIAPFEGKLLFYTDLPQATVQAPTTRLKLIAEDIYETQYSAEQLLGAWNKQGART